MFEFGRELRRLFEKARFSDDLGWLELISVDLVKAEARQQTIDAGKVSCPRPFDVATRASGLWREHARRSGASSSLSKADENARFAARLARNDDQALLARLELAQTALLAFDLSGDSERLTACVALLEALPSARRGDTSAALQAQQARLKARQASLSGETSDLEVACDQLTRALDTLRHSNRNLETEVRLERASLSLEIGLSSRDLHRLDQAGRDLRNLVEQAPADQRPLTRARALAMCATGMAALAAIADNADAHAQARALFEAATEQFTIDHSPLDWAAIQLLRAERETLPLINLLQAETVTDGGGLVLGAQARERRVAQETERADTAGDLTALLAIETRLQRRLRVPTAASTPLDWAADQIGMATVALARGRCTGQTPNNIGLILIEAATTAREHGASGLAQRARELLAQPQTV